MKAIYLPHAIEKIVRALSYVAVFILDIVNFILTPITWVKFKAHIFMASIAGIYYVYFGLVLQQGSAQWYAISSFIIAALSIALIKFARKKLIELRHFLMGLFYTPVGLCFYVKPVFHRQHNKNYNNFTKYVTLD